MFTCLWLHARACLSGNYSTLGRNTLFCTRLSPLEPRYNCRIVSSSMLQYYGDQMILVNLFRLVNLRTAKTPCKLALISALVHLAVALLRCNLTHAYSRDWYRDRGTGLNGGTLLFNLSYPTHESPSSFCHCSIRDECNSKLQQIIS